MDEISENNPGDTENPLQKRLKHIIGTNNLDAQREQIQILSALLNISVLDCAAALLFLSHPQQSPEAKANVKTEPAKAVNRFVRYRLDVGSQHHVLKEQIQAVLIEESGVDRKRIGKIDIRTNYTLVELPDGMPADIFQLLSEATIGERKLAIKRVKPNRRGK